MPPNYKTACFAISYTLVSQLIHTADTLCSQIIKKTQAREKLSEGVHILQDAVDKINSTLDILNQKLRTPNLKPGKAEIYHGHMNTLHGKLIKLAKKTHELIQQIDILDHELLFNRAALFCLLQAFQPEAPSPIKPASPDSAIFP